MQPRSGDTEAALASPDQLAALSENFPQFRIWREIIGKRVRYIARSLHPDIRPHTVVTSDPAELRAELEPARYRALVPYMPGQPNIARMYGFLLDGKDHLPSDRAAGGEILREFPEIAQPTGHFRPAPSATPPRLESPSSLTSAPSCRPRRTPTTPPGR